MKYILGLYLYILLLSQCKYDNIVEAQKIRVPDYTETGANTFGANIDGIVWVNFGKTKINQEISSYYEDNVVQKQIPYNPGGIETSLTISGQLTIWNKGKDIRDESLNFTVNKVSKTFKGQYLLKRSGNRMVYTKTSTGMYYSATDYISTDNNPLKLTIKADTLLNGKRIISGVFEGYLFHTTGTGRLAVIDSVNVTGGVFDVDMFSK